MQRIGRALVPFSPSYRKNPRARSEIKRVLADGDSVILPVHGVREPGTPGNAIVDIFRLEGGKIVEHWDVIQPVPETAAYPTRCFEHAEQAAARDEIRSGWL